MELFYFQEQKESGEDSRTTPEHAISSVILGEN